MKHLIQIVGLLESDQRHDHITEDSRNHRDEEYLHGIDRELEGIHLPYDIRGERRGNRLKHIVDRIAVTETRQPRIDAFRPVLLHRDAADRNHGAADQRSERARRRPETAVKTADHHGTRTAAPDACHDREKHIDIVHLRKEDRAAEEEYRHAQRQESQIPQMLFRSQRLLFQRHDDILHDRGRCVEDTRIVRGQHQHDHQQSNQPDHESRQNVAENDRHHHLIIKRAESLVSRIAVLLLRDDIRGFAQILRVGIVHAGELLALLKHDLRLCRKSRDDLPAHRGILHGLGGDFGGKLIADLFRLRSKIPVRHQSNHADGDDHAHQEAETVPP